MGVVSWALDAERRVVQRAGGVLPEPLYCQFSLPLSSAPPPPPSRSGGKGDGGDGGGGGGGRRGTRKRPRGGDRGRQKVLIESTTPNALNLSCVDILKLNEEFFNPGILQHVLSTLLYNTSFQHVRARLL